MKFSEVDPSTLIPNPWNPNIVSPQNEEKLAESIDELSFFKPAIVRTLPDGTRQILGGEHRVDYARLRGVKVPIVDLGEIDDVKAKKISVIDNSRYGADDTLRLAELLSELGSQEELSSILPYSNAEIDAILVSTSIDLNDLDLLDDDDEPALHEPTTDDRPLQTHQIMRFKVPVEDAESFSELIEYINKTQKFDDPDSMINAGDALIIMSRAYRDAISQEDQ